MTAETITDAAEAVVNAAPATGDYERARRQQKAVTGR